MKRIFRLPCFKVCWQTQGPDINSSIIIPRITSLLLKLYIIFQTLNNLCVRFKSLILVNTAPADLFYKQLANLFFQALTTELDQYVLTILCSFGTILDYCKEKLVEGRYRNSRYACYIVCIGYLWTLVVCSNVWSYLD